MRTIACLAVLALAAVSCGAGDDDAAGAATTTAADPGSVVGPTTSTTVPADCLLLADEYVQAAQALFDAAPTDSLVDATGDRLAELDSSAAGGGCGDAYRMAVCDGLDELTLSGTLVIYQMLTASCI